MSQVREPRKLSCGLRDAHEPARFCRDSRALAIWVAMHSRGERIFSPECG